MHATANNMAAVNVSPANTGENGMPEKLVWPFAILHKAERKKKTKGKSVYFLLLLHF